jgi:hypothetical protein
MQLTMHIYRKTVYHSSSMRLSPWAQVSVIKKWTGKEGRASNGGQLDPTTTLRMINGAGDDDSDTAVIISPMARYILLKREK